MKAALATARDMIISWTLKVDSARRVLFVATNVSRCTGRSLGLNMGVAEVVERGVLGSGLDGVCKTARRTVGGAKVNKRVFERIDCNLRRWSGIPLVLYSTRWLRGTDD